MELKDRNILVGVSGSVAAIRVPRLVKFLMEREANVKVVATEAAVSFIENEERLPEEIQVLKDKDEWQTWKKISDPIMHIELRNWADLFVIAPLSANTMAKLANGICDNLLTCIARAWPFNYEKPLVVAPAMNTTMWLHPITDQQIKQLEKFGVRVVHPISKQLACGDVGVGAMAESIAIVRFIVDCMSKNDSLQE